MTVRAALRAALWETYQYSWRLLVVNTALSLAVIGVALAMPTLALGLLIAPAVAGPVAAALAHCVVTLVREEDFRLSDAVEGLRRHWRRGVVLGGMIGVGLMLGALAVGFYSSSQHRAWPLAVLAVYLVALYCLVVLTAWPLAVADPEAPLADALRTAVTLLFRRPGRVLALGAALLLVNLLGAVTVLPLLTLTIAFSFLAAAHVVLAPSTKELVSDGQRHL